MPLPVRDNKRAMTHGFTLIELVVGITLVAIASTLLVSLVVPAWRQSAEPLVQQRAASLAQSLMDEILSKRYDETTPEGGVPRCTTCTGTLGAESGETRATYDDVDDYDEYCGGDVQIRDANNDLMTGYDSYRMRICVSYDSGYNGGNAGPDAKRITVTITPSANVPVIFTAYRANF